MKNRALILLMVVLVAFTGNVFAQGGAAQVHLNATTNGTTVTVPSDGIFLYDDDAAASGCYSANTNYSITVQGSCVNPNKLSLTVETFDIAATDTLYVYDGNSTSAPLILMCNNTYNSQLNQIIYASSLNTTNCLTIRLATHSSNGRGFSMMVACKFPCESVTPVIENTFYKVKNGVIIDTCTIRPFMVHDTVIHIDDNNDTTISVVDETFRGVNLCLGEDVIFNGHGEYTHNHGAYNPMDATTTFRWNFGNGDTLYDLGATQALAYYHDLDCYDVILSMVDEQGCKSSIYESVRVRLAQNPIKTLYDLATICNSDSLLVNVGYEGENGTITLKTISFEKMKSRTYAAKTFIPDGPNCEVQCFSAPVTFDDFPNGRTVTDGADICSVCINFEHEFMGDYKMSIICPSGQSAMLKAKETPSAQNGYPAGTGAGGGTFTGYPYGGTNHHTYDGQSGHYCDSIYNMFGVGLDYCFTRNSEYAMITENYPNTDNVMGIAYNGAGAAVDNITYTFQAIPAPYDNAGATAGTCSFPTRHPSDHTNKSDYYLPTSDFSSLVGCPLNGSWQAEICDTWGADNGWIFSWSLDICGVSSGTGCEYQVGLDSVLWLPDSASGDFLLGHYRGATIWNRDSINSYIAPPDTAGYFPIHVTLYDQFGCIWDTLTHITTVWTPRPDLGSDTVLCSVENMQLFATDRNSNDSTRSYMWEPYGDSTANIWTKANVGTSTLYTVEVTNTESSIRCRARDSIRVNVYQQPVPNFDPGIYPLEGCEPFTINITNSSVGADKYLWVFGDGDTSNLKDPTHTYAAGRYGFKFYAASNVGCKDSLVYDDLITVFSSPDAKFSWEPVNPTVLHPMVNFINMTEPQSNENKYYWEIQYDRYNHASYHTLTDVNPSFEWRTKGEDISGNHIARLIAKTTNLGPSGNNVECRDTMENSILLVNDFLQFPNVITANGDGVNDKFVIGNLVNGMGYPNNSLSIFNRWGKRVYYKENISKDEDFWDPGADNLPAGTYYWRFSGKGYLGDIQRNGCVEVLK